MQTTKTELLAALQFFFPDTDEHDCLLTIAPPHAARIPAIAMPEYKPRKAFDTSKCIFQFCLNSDLHYSIEPFLNLDAILQYYRAHKNTK